MTEVWQSELRRKLVEDPSVWSVADGMQLIALAEQKARLDPEMFDWFTQTYTPAGIAWITREVES